MSVKSGISQLLHIQGFDLSGDVTSINDLASPRTVHDVPVLNAAGMKRILSRGDCHLNVTSWFNDATERAHDAFKTLPAGQRLCLYSMGGAIGDVAAMLQARQVGYDGSEGEDGSLSFTIDMAGDGGLEWADMITAGQDTISSSGNESAVDQAAQTTAGLAATLQIVSIASGTPTVTIMDSTNGSTSWGTIITFTAVAAAAAPTAERKVASGTIKRYLRITTTGSFSDLVLLVATRRGTAGDTVAYA
jgi:hypothetical protein